MPLTISVVIPVKNDARPLTECLRMLAAQTRRPDEIVVVDNGCTDDSAEVARAAGARVVECTRPGIPAASATGYDAATGEIIARLDADCAPPATWVETVADAFARHPDVSAVTGGARFVDGPVPLRRWLAAAYLGSYYVLTATMLGHVPVFGSNMAMRRSAWKDVRDEVHRGDPFVHDDLDLAFHLGEKHRIRYERRLRMGISMRPFADLRSALVRGARGGHTVLVHYPYGGAPWRLGRRLRRVAAERFASAVPGRGEAR